MERRLFDNDDTVQVVLGVADPEIAVRGKVNVGGYEGAMDNEFTAADFYYTYSVNAVNAQQRQFNEAPQGKAAFPLRRFAVFRWPLGGGDGDPIFRLRA